MNPTLSDSFDNMKALATDTVWFDKVFFVNSKTSLSTLQRLDTTTQSQNTKTLATFLGGFWQCVTTLAKI